MSAPPFRRASPSPGPSSVQQWILRYAIVISALIVVVSTSSSDICGANFGDKMHTIGPVDGDLWAITKDNWTVYKLTPCDVANDSLVHCMEVGSPVSLDSKWPELIKSVKEAVNKTEYDLTFDNSVIGYICNTGTKDDVQVQFSNVSCTTGEMTFNVSRGVLYRNQFYLFGSDKVYIFLDKSDKTKLVELSYETFFPCKKPTTTMVPLISSNQTSRPPNQTMSTHANANQLNLVAIVLIAVSFILLATLILILVCFCLSCSSNSSGPVDSDMESVNGGLLPPVKLMRYEDWAKLNGPIVEERQDPTVFSLPSLKFAPPSELSNLPATEDFKVIN